MSDTSGVPEAVRLLDLLIESVDWQGMLSAPLSKSEVLARLEEVKGALADVIPEWAEVTVSEVIAERDDLRAEPASSRSTESRMHHERDDAERLLREALPCDGGCNYSSGPEEMCSRDGRPVREVWGIVQRLTGERDERTEERDLARSIAVRLEQELAESDLWIEAYKAFVAQLEAQAVEVSP